MASTSRSAENRLTHTEMLQRNHENVLELYDTFIEPLQEVQVCFHLNPHRHTEQHEKDITFLKFFANPMFADFPEEENYVQSNFLNNDFKDSLVNSFFGNDFPYGTWFPNSKCFGFIDEILETIKYIRNLVKTKFPQGRSFDEKITITRILSEQINNFFTDKSQFSSLKDALNVLKKVPNLGDVTQSEVAIYRAAPPIPVTHMESVATSTAFLKMRCYQLKCAMVFNPWFTTFVAKLMQRFKERNGPVHAYIGILEIQIQLLLLFAKGKFERAFYLAQQGAEALENFLDRRGAWPNPCKSKITPPVRINNAKVLIRRNDPDNIHRLRDDISLFFPLGEQTDMDTLFVIDALFSNKSSLEVSSEPPGTDVKFHVEYFQHLFGSMQRYIGIIQGDQPGRTPFLKSFLGNFRAIIANLKLCPGCKEQKIMEANCRCRCGTAYCSPNCQRLDLPEHKLICTYTYTCAFCKPNGEKRFKKCVCGKKKIQEEEDKKKAIELEIKEQNELKKLQREKKKIEEAIKKSEEEKKEALKKLGNKMKELRDKRSGL